MWGRRVRGGVGLAAGRHGCKRMREGGGSEWRLGVERPKARHEASSTALLVKAHACARLRPLRACEGRCGGCSSDTAGSRRPTTTRSGCGAPTATSCTSSPTPAAACRWVPRRPATPLPGERGGGTVVCAWLSVLCRGRAGEKASREPCRAEAGTSSDFGAGGGGEVAPSKWRQGLTFKRLCIRCRGPRPCPSLQLHARLPAACWCALACSCRRAGAPHLGGAATHPPTCLPRPGLEHSTSPPSPIIPALPRPCSASTSTTPTGCWWRPCSTAWSLCTTWTTPCRWPGEVWGTMVGSAGRQADRQAGGQAKGAAGRPCSCSARPSLP